MTTALATIGGGSRPKEEARGDIHSEKHSLNCVDIMISGETCIVSFHSSHMKNNFLRLSASMSSASDTLNES